MEKEITMCLCEGRHAFPGDPKGIFGETIADPMDFKHLYEIADKAIAPGVENLKLYATGLSSALLAVVDVCACRRINLIVLHYDKTDDTYREQRVGPTYETCPFCKNRMSSLDYVCPHCGG